MGRPPGPVAAIPAMFDCLRALSLGAGTEDQQFVNTFPRPARSAFPPNCRWRTSRSKLRFIMPLAAWESTGKPRMHPSRTINLHWPIALLSPRIGAFRDPRAGRRPGMRKIFNAFATTVYPELRTTRDTGRVAIVPLFPLRCHPALVPLAYSNGCHPCLLACLPRRQ